MTDEADIRRQQEEWKVRPEFEGEWKEGIAQIVLHGRHLLKPTGKGDAKMEMVNFEFEGDKYTVVIGSTPVNPPLPDNVIQHDFTKKTKQGNPPEQSV